jgi:hypothetical protein
MPPPYAAKVFHGFGEPFFAPIDAPEAWRGGIVFGALAAAFESAAGPASSGRFLALDRAPISPDIDRMDHRRDDPIPIKAGTLPA